MNIADVTKNKTDIENFYMKNQQKI